MIPAGGLLPKNSSSFRTITLQLSDRRSFTHGDGGEFDEWLSHVEIVVLGRTPLR
jgi:hypothetical protein